MGSLLALIKGRASLVLGGLVLLALLGLYIALQAARLHVAKLETAVSTLQVTAEAQKAAIADMKQLRENDTKAVLGLAREYRALVQADSGVRQQLQQLERSNAQVRDYLSQPVPAELGCLLNGTCDKDTAL